MREEADVSKVNMGMEDMQQEFAKARAIAACMRCAASNPDAEASAFHGVSGYLEDRFAELIGRKACWRGCSMKIEALYFLMPQAQGLAKILALASKSNDDWENEIEAVGDCLVDVLRSIDTVLQDSCFEGEL